MKAILLSIKPEWVAKILNGEKTIEIRKKFPKDYVGWVYIYCTKSNNKLIKGKDKFEIFNFTNDMVMKDHNTGKELNINVFSGNGKVVARFWCDKVERILYRNWIDIEISVATHEDENNLDNLKEINRYDIIKNSCLTKKDLDRYVCKYDGILSSAYAIHISKLELFDRPRELSELLPNKIEIHKCIHGSMVIDEELSIPRKAPQNYCYVEVDNEHSTN